jgi:hypothetical protein
MRCTENPQFHTRARLLTELLLNRIYKNAAPNSQKSHCVFITQTNCMMLCGKHAKCSDDL